MWWKSWMECRFRAWLTGLVLVLYLGAALGPLIEYKGGDTAWDWYSKFVSVFSTVVAAMFAGSGINSQTSWGMMRGFHPSMYFLLSLPVSRRKTLFVRAAVGLMLTFLYVLLSIALYAVLAPLRGAHISIQQTVSSILFISLGAFVMFGISTFLSTMFDEMVTQCLAIGAVVGAFGMWMGLDWGKVTLDPMAIMDGRQLAQTGHMAWVVVALCLVSGMAFLMGALQVVERKEY